MQETLKIEIDWVEQPPLDIVDTWKKIEKELHYVEILAISQWINYHLGREIQLLVFCDASEKGFIASCEEIKINLLIAKTKVALLKLKRNP